MRFLLRLCCGLTLSAVAAHAALDQSGFTAKELAQGYSDLRVLAKPRTAYRDTAASAETAEGLRVQAQFSRFGGLRILRLSEGETVPQALRRLRATGRYEYVEPDRILHARLAPNDLYYSSQWSLPQIGAPTAWATRTDASSVVVGVIDSGLKLNHQDLAGALWSKSGSPNAGTHGISAINGDGTITNYTPDDTDVGHGTHVSGIIGAVGNNNLGISGVAWKARIMGLRFLHGTDGTGSTSDEITCINYAIANGAKVINGSYGSSNYSSSEYDAIKSARDHDIVFVVAAGNDANDSDRVGDYPSGYPLDNIVSVAATDQSDALADFSNYGSGSVDLAAPGVDILSAWNSAPNDYANASGTSMAAPHVTGAVALLRAQFPGDTYRQIINRLLRSVAKKAALDGKVQTGGRLDLAAALTSSSNLPFNDAFASRAHLAGGTARVRTSNVGATTESGEPTAAGGATLWWTWTATDSTDVIFETTGSSYDTQLAVYTGSALNALTVVGSNDDNGSATTSRLVLPITAGTTYQIAVGGKAGATGYTAFHLGTVPANDTFATARLLTGASVTESGTTMDASRQSGEPTTAGVGAGHTVWYKWVAPASGHYSLAAFATTIDTAAAVYTGSSLASLTLVASNDNNQDGDNSDALVPFHADAGTTYYFQIDDHDSGDRGGDFILTLTDSVWEYPTRDEVSSSPAVAADGTVYFGAGSADYGFDTQLYAVNPDGTLKWSAPTGGNGIIDASPAIGPDGTVYVGADDGKLHAFNGDGTQKWTYTATSAIASTPAVGRDGTIYFRDETTLYALTDNGRNATLKWSYLLSSSSAGGTYASPAIGRDGTIYIGSSGGAFYAFTDGGTGATVKWIFDAFSDIYTSAALADDGTIYFATLYGAIYALTDGGSSATMKWSYALPIYNNDSNSITSSPAIGADGTVYFAAYDHNLYAIDATGAKKWSCALGDVVKAASPAIAADGTVYVGCYDGQVYAVSAAGVLVRTYPTAKTIRSSPVIANQRLYFGSADAKLHAFDLGQDAATSAWPMAHHDASHTGRSAEAAGTAPAILTPPASQTVDEGSSATFFVEATGTAPLLYEWRKDGVLLAGATSATLTLPLVDTGSPGQYTVTVSNRAGSAEASATLAVTPASSAPDAPVATAATEVTSTGFTANWNRATKATIYQFDVARDPGFVSSLIYWNQNAGGATSAAVTGLEPAVTYYFRVWAWNSSGRSTSSNVISATTEPTSPAITSPNSTTFTLGLDCRFVVTAIGTPTPTFSAIGLPGWATLDATTGELRGTAPAGTSGARIALTLTAHNTSVVDATQVFTLAVAAAPDASAGGGTPLVVTTFAGTAGLSGSTDATGSAARFNHPSGIAINSAGTLYVADTDNNTIRQITAAGAVTTFAGSSDSSGYVNASGTAARFSAPTGLTMDENDRLDVADTLNNAIRQITPAGEVTDLISSGFQLSGPQGIAHFPSWLYVADTNNHLIRQFYESDSTIFYENYRSGEFGTAGSSDGSESGAHFNAPSDVAVDAAGNAYVADTENNTIRKLDPAGYVTTLAGLAGAIGAADGVGSAARFNHPTALTVDSTQNLIVLDTDNGTLRRIDPATGTVTTIAGLAGSSGSTDGSGSAARFDHPTAIAQASTGEFYIADTNNHTIRQAVFAGAPAITAQPQDTSVTAGSTASFSVKATGDAMLTYQWLLNGVALSGETSSTLTMANVTSSNAGNYSVIVSNSLGSVTSAVASLTVTASTNTNTGTGGGSTSGGGSTGSSGSGGGGGGGGAPSLWFFTLLTLMAGLRRGSAIGKAHRASAR